MINQKLDEIVEAARLHYENCLSDIENASTRIEHLRLSALAEEAGLVLQLITNFSLGLVYTHVTPGSTGPTHTND
jgi:hypothetical protein